MKIKLKSDIEGIIILILCASLLNDALRIPDTAISLYRILIPVACLIILRYCQILKKEIIAIFFIFILNILQNILSVFIFNLFRSFSAYYFTTYAIHYFSFFICMLLVKLLCEKYPEKGIKYFSFINMFACYWTLIINVISSTGIYNITVNNRNTFAVVLAATTPYFLSTWNKHKIKNSIVVLAVFLELYFFDSKAAFFGVLLEVCITIVLQSAHYVKEKVVHILLTTLIFGTAGIMILFNISVTINGYNINYMFFEMFRRIRDLNLFPVNTTSLRYRVNVIIYGIRTLAQTFAVGIGEGNFGRLLAQYMPDQVISMHAKNNALSPHYALLEYVVDNGWWLIILLISWYRRIFKLLKNIQDIGNVGICYIVFFITMPLWIMSSSGIYTIYAFFINLSFLNILVKEETIWKKQL